MLDEARQLRIINMHGRWLAVNTTGTKRQDWERMEEREQERRGRRRGGLENGRGGKRGERME